ncbi:MAG TPA: HAD family acid phosphatase [Terracidiphilus sp.]|jgi:acid phosphatase
MKLIRSSLSFGSLLMLGVSFLPAQQHRAESVAASESIPNLGPLLERANALKVELRRYQTCSCTCGCYAKDLDIESDRAIDFLHTRAAHRRGSEKLALVLDIDETTLSNWAEMDDANFEYNSREFNAWIESAQAPAIPGTLQLYNEARKLGVAVFFLTGRPESQRAATEANLRLRGFGEWQQLIMRNAEQKDETALVFKSGERRKIIAAGFRVVLNVGDQWSDLRGAPEAEYSVKYPDPVYFVK